MLIENLNREAVRELFRDADRTLALAYLVDVRGNPTDALRTIEYVRRSYCDLVRRSTPLVMRDPELISFQAVLVCIKSTLHMLVRAIKRQRTSSE